MPTFVNGQEVNESHYEMSIQPVEFIEKNHLGFAEGNVIKYVCRHKRKDGARDLMKAKRYIDFILKYEYGIGDETSGTNVADPIKIREPHP